MPFISASRPRWVDHAGKTFMIEDLPVVTPMKYIVRRPAGV
jgi:hypothetical protein